jgi:tRNA pseudouridine38-40 synthase
VNNVKIIVKYDGTNYHGWQIQPRGRTIQGELTRVLSLLDHRALTVHGAGRTDSGVHAEGQVASFMLERDFEPERLRDAINGNLDPDIRVSAVHVVDGAFHARYSAVQKTYKYQIYTGAVASPFSYRYCYHFRGRLNVATMREAAGLLRGRHDFSAFTVSDSEAADHIRELRSLDLDQSADVLIVTATADGFLKYMVRTIVGTLIDVGRGRQDAPGLVRALETGDRSLAGPTAPPSGLTLFRVDY